MLRIEQEVKAFECAPRSQPACFSQLLTRFSSRTEVSLSATRSRNAGLTNKAKVFAENRAGPLY
nr:hypothetical protein [Mesorhizobium sp.]